MPSLDVLSKTFEDKGLEVLLINLKEESALVTSFIEANDYSSTVLLDREGTVARQYSVYGIPVSYLIDREGNVATTSVGFVDWSAQDMRNLVKSLIKE